MLTQTLPGLLASDAVELCPVAPTQVWGAEQRAAIEDAFAVLMTTGLDAMLCDELLIEKPN